MGKEIGSRDTKSTITSKDDKTEKYEMFGQGGKNNTIEKQIEVINQKVLGEKGRLKTHRDGTKQYRQKRTFQINERKFYLKFREGNVKTMQQQDARKAKLFWSTVWERGNHNKKAEWQNCRKVSQKPKRRIYTRIPNWKTPGLDSMHGFWFKQFTSIHDKLTIEISRY